MGTRLILPDLVLPSRRNQRWQYSGLDSPDQCLNKNHFVNYPYTVEYAYNSRGFRDDEWPADIHDLESSIWCVGDSFTVGLGQPYPHIWPQVLQTRTSVRTINVSMDGASNQWIARRSRQIIETIAPKYMVIMWSYIHRRESTDLAFDDEQRRLISSDVSMYEDLLCFFQILDDFCDIDTTKIIHCIVPGGLAGLDKSTLSKIWNDIRGPDWPKTAPQCFADLEKCPDFVRRELKENFNLYDTIGILTQCQSMFDWCDRSPLFLGEISRRDIARDGHHFDILTSESLTDQIIALL
jgi:hypothetical protein